MSGMAKAVLALAIFGSIFGAIALSESSKHHQNDTQTVVIVK